MNVNEKIAAILGDKDHYLYAVADVKGLLGREYSEFCYAISIARKLEDDIVDEIGNGPTPRYLQNYRNVNTELTWIVKTISAILAQSNIKNVPIKPTYEDSELEAEYLVTLRTPFSHKMAATRAGLGWIGKTDLLITHEFGPRVRLASILLDSEIQKAGTPIDKSECGNCTVCVENCPAFAANGKSWDIGTDRDEFFDAFKCRKKCRELSRIHLNEDISLCGRCVALCPVGS